MLASKPSVAPHRRALLQQGLAGGNPVLCGNSKYEMPLVIALW